MPLEVDRPDAQRKNVLLRQVFLFDAPVVLEGLDRCDQHHGRGLEPRHAALDVKKLLGAKVGAKARLGHDVVCQA